MDLNRGFLARIDRKLLAGLGQDEVFRMVRVPVSVARWSMWKRCRDSAGVSMGRAIVTLIDRELVSVFGESNHDDPPMSLRAGQVPSEVVVDARLRMDEKPHVEETSTDSLREDPCGWQTRAHRFRTPRPGVHHL